MQRLICPILSLAIVAATAGAALAQADAQQVYRQAKAAYESGEFATARDLAKKASQTDAKNPEVFLLLGKSHYQLGELDEAIAAWKRTLSLAPEEPFAARMLRVLRAEKVKVDTRIKLLEALVHEELLDEALRESGRLLAEKTLSESQRATTLLLQAQIVLKLGRPAETLARLNHLRVLYPKQFDPVQAMLLEGQAKLAGGGRPTVEGKAILERLVADHPGAPATATARYALIAYELRQGVNPARAGALAKWLAESPGHPRVGEALRALVEAYLSVTRQGARPTPKAELTKWDVDALALADELYKQTPNAKEAEQLTKLLLKHLDEHYAKHGAYAAAVKGAELQRGVPLPRKSRLLILRAVVRYKTAIAMKHLGDQARLGKLPATAPVDDEPPKVLRDVLAQYDAIAGEYPSQPAWTEQVKLAGEVRKYAAKVRPPMKVVRYKGPDTWAVDISRQVIKADADAAAVKAAVDLVQTIITDYEKCENLDARAFNLGVSRTLTTVLSQTHASWPDVMMRHAERLDADARHAFTRNLESGDGERNARRSDVQQELLQTLEKLVANETPRAPAALKLVGQHLQPWIAQGHWALAEEIYTTLAKALPESERRQAELAVVKLWTEQVTREHQRLLAAGFTVPRQLDPRLKKALARCCKLQAELDPKSKELASVRGIWDAILHHYRTLEYYEVVDAAIKVKAERAVDAADEYAQFTLARQCDLHARRELTRFLKQYGASERIVLTPAFKEAIAAYMKFITDRPGSRFVSPATERIFEIGRLFEQKKAFAVASGVYGGLAKFAAGVKVLSQSAPDKPSAAERATFTSAVALDSQARKMLAEALALRKSDDLPPAKLSDEFAAAIAAYTGFSETKPDSPLVGDATTKIMSIAHEYAKIDAWDVADGVYADLLKSKLKIRRAERLQFARGLCQLGRAMPKHAREVLSVLTSGGLRGSGEALGPEMLAQLVRSDSLTLGFARAELQAPSGGGPRSSVAGRRPADTPSAQPPAEEPAEEADGRARRDVQLLAMIRRQQSDRAAQVAQLRERLVYNAPPEQQVDQEGKQAAQRVAQRGVLSKAELARQEKAISAAYEIFQGIRKEYPHTPTARQARGEILVMVGHWRTLSQWQRSAALAERFLADNPTNAELPKLRLEIGRNRLAWASKPIERKATKQVMLAEVSKRFDAARKELAKIVTDFPRERSYQQQAQWDIANSFLTQARVVAAFSPTPARGQYVRTTKELRLLAEKYPDHPKIGTIPQMLWNVSNELEGRGYYEETILVWNELIIHAPVHALSQQAALKIAQTYHQKLKRPLKAAEAYQELNFTRGGGDQTLQNAIFQIGSELKGEKRWVEALHVLETFVDSFPRHPQAGTALTMVGQIHQTNEAWEDAIAAYRRVIVEFKNGKFVQDAKWAIAGCTINLSQWREAADAYRVYAKAYPKDSKLAEAKRRIEVFKDLVRYQGLVDEERQRKAFDAQYQIAAIVGTQLSNPVKAIIEYRKVVKNWPESHLADDALYAVGTTYLSLGETEQAREALLAAAEKYPASPLADDALFMVGKSHEDEAQKLATVTREKSLEEAKDVAQKHAYKQAQTTRRLQQEFRGKRIASLRKGGKGEAASVEEAAQAAIYGQFSSANVALFAQKAYQEVEALTATQLADRQDKINAALRKAVESYTSASKVAGADKADDALLKMATIYDQQLRDSKAAMQTWLEIVRQFSGTGVAEDASWRIAQVYEREGKYAEAIEAYKAFLRNYRRSPKAGAAQFAIAENHEHLGQWVAAMDSYTNYMTNFPDGPLVKKAKEQINWIKTYRL